jgi:hypothetical protein
VFEARHLGNAEEPRELAMIALPIRLILSRGTQLITRRSAHPFVAATEGCACVDDASQE